MTREGLADYCVQQVRVTSNAPNYFSKPQDIPDFTAIEKTLVAFGVNTAWPRSVPSVASGLDFVSREWTFHTNLKLRKTILLIERARLIRNLNKEQLCKLAEDCTLSYLPLP